MGEEVISQAEIEALINEAGKDVEAGATDESQAVSSQAQSEPAITVSTASDSPVRTAAFVPMASASDSGARHGVDLIMDVRLNVAVELGRSTLPVREILTLGPGRVVELDKHAGEPVEVVINNKVVARGEVVVIDENFGVRITEIVGVNERESHAKAA